MAKEISSSTAGRLPSYFRCLRGLIVDGCLRVSSAELAERLGFTPSQVKSDLASFGRLGQQGYGYAVKPLYKEISKLLCVGDNISAIILTGEECGISLLCPVFEGRGITLKAVFFDDETSAGCSCGPEEGGLRGAAPEDADGARPELYGFSKLREYLESNSIDIAMIMHSKKNVREAERVLSECGIRGVWNLSSTDVHIDGAVVKNLPLGDILMSLCYDMKNKKKKSARTEKKTALS